MNVNVMSYSVLPVADVDLVTPTAAIAPRASSVDFTSAAVAPSSRSADRPDVPSARGERSSTSEKFEPNRINASSSITSCWISYTTSAQAEAFFGAIVNSYAAPLRNPVALRSDAPRA